MNRTVAVTGATGFIGRHLVADLAARGIDVRAIVRPESARPLPPGVTAVRAPLEAPLLHEAFAGVDAVVHLAGLVAGTNRASYHAVNVEGTRAVADAARAAGAHLVHISSLAAAGPAPPDAPRREDDPPRPITTYGVTKLASERVVSGTGGLRWTVLRPGAVYGPGDRAVLPLFRLASSGIVPLVGCPGAAYTFVHVRDLVAAIGAALDVQPHGETLFVGHPRPITARELLAAIQLAVGRRALVVTIPTVVAMAAAALADAAGQLVGHPLPLTSARLAELTAEGFVCRVDRLRDRLGVTAAIELADGLAETAAWYRREGWLR